MSHPPVANTSSTKVAKVFIHRNFGLLWVGQTASSLGDFLFIPTLVLWVAFVIAPGQSWTPLAVSGISVATIVPILTVSPFAGVFVDRWNTRRTMLVMDALRGILTLLLLLSAGIISLPFLTISRLPVFWQLGFIYIVVLFMGTCTQFFFPSMMALIGNIVDEADQARASSRLQVVTNLATLIGPSVASILFFSVGFRLALLFNALSFFISFLTILMIHPSDMSVSGKPEKPKTFLQDFIDGLRFIGKNSVVMALLITLILIGLGEGAFSTLNVFFLTVNLHASAQLFGFLQTSVGLGLVVSSLFGNIIAQRLGRKRAFWISVILAGLVMLGYSRMTNFLPALIALFLYGLFMGIQDVMMMPILLQATPQSLVGRVFAVLAPLVLSMTLLSNFLAGYSYSIVLRGFSPSLLGISFNPLSIIYFVVGIFIILGGFYSWRKLPEGVAGTEHVDQHE